VALAVLAFGYLAVVGLRSLAGTASADPAAPNPGHSWSQIGDLPGTLVTRSVFSAATVDDPANAVGQYTSMTIGADGLPVISYRDYPAAALKVAHCSNASCSATDSITTVDDPAVNNQWVGQTSITIGADGLPVISYNDFAAGALKVAHCGDASCSAGNTISTVDDPANGVGQYSSITIGADGLPVISYRDTTATALKVAHCGNASCSASNTISTVDDPPVNTVGFYTSITIGADGLPVISYGDSTALSLKVAHCSNASCSATDSITTVDDPANNVCNFSSITIGADGLPVISYLDNTAGALKVAHCSNALCSATDSITTVDDPANTVGLWTSITIGADGLPVISYFDDTADALKVAHCGNASCSAGNTITTVDDPANNVGQCTSMTIGADGLAVISYFDDTADALKVAHCSNRFCVPYHRPR
jgi:hypothetical protein